MNLPELKARLAREGAYCTPTRFEEIDEIHAASLAVIQLLENQVPVNEAWNGTDELRVGHLVEQGRVIGINTMMVAVEHAGEFVVYSRCLIRQPADKFDKLAKAMFNILGRAPRPPVQVLANALRSLEGLQRIVVSGEQL